MSTLAAVGEEASLRALNGKTCLVTGGAGSIGRASAKLFLAEGARVMLVDLHEAELARVANQLGGDVAHCAADVTNAGAVAHCIATTVNRFGPIDVLFSNAGNF